MDGCSNCAGSFSENTTCKSYVCCLSSEKSSIEHKQFACNCNEVSGKTKPLVALDISSSCKEDDLDVQDFGSVLGGTLHVSNTHKNFFGLNSTSQDDIVIANENKMNQEFNPPSSLDSKVQMSLSKSATFPCSTEVQGRAGSPYTSERGQSPASENPSYTRSISLPTSLKVASAMKGGRALNGVSLDAKKLHVKWAVEVYDPPTTIVSHTVKSNHQRPKVKKKGKHKNKGKPSRGSCRERKNTNGSIGNVPDPRDKRLSSTVNGLLLDGYLKSSSQEAKCGISFLKEGLANVHLSITEAS